MRVTKTRKNEQTDAKCANDDVPTTSWNGTRADGGWCRHVDVIGSKHSCIPCSTTKALAERQTEHERHEYRRIPAAVQFLIILK